MIAIPKTATVLIIGGGPSGATAATMLAKEGIDVMVLEKTTFPRYKIGESIIPHFWKFTDQLGVTEAIASEGFIKKGGGAAYWDGTLRRMSFKNYGHTRQGLHVERDRFDEILLTHAKKSGALVIENHEVKKVTKKGEYWNVEFKNTIDQTLHHIQCEFLIDASGQTAVVARQMGFRVYDEQFKFQAFWGYFDQSDYLSTAGKVVDFSQRFEIAPMSLTSGIGDWGWVWHLVLREKVSVGAIIPRHKLAAFKEGGTDLDNRFLTQIRATPLTSQLLGASKLISPVRTIRDYAYLPTKLSFDKCYLIGDAAAFADPINSEGVSMSMYGGILAAWSVEQSLKNRKRSGFYSQFYSESLEKRLKVFQLLSYPSDQIPQQLKESCMKIIANQSLEETHLILAHLVLMNRGKDFPELIQAMGLPMKEVTTVIEFDHE